MTSLLNTEDMYPTSPTTDERESTFALPSRVPKDVCIYSLGKKVYVQEKGYCPEEVLMNIKWPRIKADATAMVPCPSGISKYCTTSGVENAHFAVAFVFKLLSLSK